MYTFEMKANKTYPTLIENRLIKLWVDKVRICTDLLNQAINAGQFPSYMEPLIKGLYPKFEERALQLYDKKLTYGGFVRSQDEDYLSFQRESEEAKKTFTQQQDESRREVLHDQERREEVARQERHDQEQRELTQRQEQQRQAQNDINNRADRCQVARQNAASYCNIKPGQLNVFGSYDCGLWQGRINQVCR